MISPVLQPFIEYSPELTEKEKKIAKVAVKDIETEYDFSIIRRYCVENITKLNEEWKVVILQYSYFNLPTIRATVIIAESEDTHYYRVLGGSFEDASPFTFYILLISIIINYLLILALPVTLIYYVLRKKRRK